MNGTYRIAHYERHPFRQFRRVAFPSIRSPRTVPSVSHTRWSHFDFQPFFKKKRPNLSHRPKVAVECHDGKFNAPDSEVRCLDGLYTCKCGEPQIYQARNIAVFSRALCSSAWRMKLDGSSLLSAGIADSTARKMTTGKIVGNFRHWQIAMTFKLSLSWFLRFSPIAYIPTL